jgi:hypothetical protein
MIENFTLFPINFVSSSTNMNEEYITGMLCKGKSINLADANIDNNNSSVNTIERWSCLYPGCNKTYNAKRNMLQHFNEKHLRHDSIPCSANCGKTFPSKPLMHKHLKYMHYNDNEKLESLIKKKKLEFDQYYANHDFNETLEVGSFVSIWDTLDVNVQENLPFDPSKSNKNLKCPKCDVILTRKSNLSLHLIKYHSQPRLYPCTYADCNKSFDYKHVLRRHLAKIHNKEQNLQK